MKVAVLISGGVDSSVALRLLKDEGHDITAFYLKIWLEDELSYLGDCPWQEDLEYAQKVCEAVDVPLEIVSLQNEYQEKIVSYTIDAIKKGQTPNPDILCNTMIKFGAFYDAVGNKFDKIATGHYAKVTEKDGQYILERAPDAIKDQTYFLAQLSPEQLSRVLFPLGPYAKEQVRQLANTFDLPTKDRKDSQGLCFLGKIKFRDFVKHHVGQKEGDLIEYETGKVVGKHDGFWFYTIGQRQGLGLSHGPWYVVDKDVDENKVFISSEYHALDKKRDSFVIDHCNWFSGKSPDKKNLHVKVRHGAQLHSCTVEKIDTNQLRVQLENRDQGIAKGQFAVLYDDTICLGSGVITQTL